MSLTIDPTDPRLTRGVDSHPVPRVDVYLILSDEERAKGFIRPYRDRAAITAKEVSGTLPFGLTLGVVECEARIRALPVE